MSQYFAVATLAGQAKLAAAVANQGTIHITAVAAGDGNGAPIVPTVNMAGLVREVWRGAPTSVSRDPASPTQVLVQATIPATAAPATIRELALYTDDGQCIVVANYPATDLAAPSQGAVNTIDVLIPLVVDTAANVTIQVNPASLVYLAGMRRAPFIGIDDFANAPPANPAADSLVVIGAAPTGAFAGLAGQFAQWNGATGLWLVAAAPLSTIVGTPAGVYYQRLADGWHEIALGQTAIDQSVTIIQADLADIVRTASLGAPATIVNHGVTTYLANYAASFNGFEAGNVCNAVTGELTVPHDGTYVVHAYGRSLDGVVSQGAWEHILAVHVNGAYDSRLVVAQYGGGQTDGSITPLQLANTVRLTAGTKLRANYYHDGANQGMGTYTTFDITRIGY